MGGAFQNSGHRLALGQVNDMMCLEKVHAFLFVWFDSLHPINNLSDINGRVYLGLTSAKLGLMCLAEEHNAVTPVRLEPAAPRSRVNHWATAPAKLQKKNPIWNYEIPQIYLSRCQSFIYDVTMHLDRLFCVLFRYNCPTFHISSWLIWPCHSQILTKTPKRLFISAARQRPRACWKDHSWESVLVS